jgi:hypothetical protein
MASVASQLIEKVTAHAQRDSLEDAQEVCADGTYFLINLRISLQCGQNVNFLLLNLKVHHATSSL